MINKRFEIAQLLGEGRSKVFFCHDKLLGNREFAIKILSSKQPKEIAAFKNEFNTLRNFDHPNIIKAYEYGEIYELDPDDEKIGLKKNDHFIILEYFEGFEPDKLPGITKESVLQELMIQIITGLYYLHQSNYIHYDIKSDNFLVNYHEGNLIVKFIDFGFTKYFRLEDESEIWGTPEYIAPEILEKDFVDHRCDLYSLGMMFYHLVYGKFPFNSKTELDIYKAHLDDDFKFPKSNYSNNFIEVIKGLLTRKPADRYFLSLNVFNELKVPISKEIKRLFQPADYIIERRKTLEAVDLYLQSETIGEMLALRGSDGFGKSHLLEFLSRQIEGSILLMKKDSSEIPFWKNLLYQLVYNDKVFKFLDSNLKSKFDSIFNDQSDDLINDIKFFLNKIAKGLKTVILIDDANLHDEFHSDLIMEIIKIWQSNNLKIIVAEDSSVELITQKCNNVSVLDLVSFSAEDVRQYAAGAFGTFFPKDQAVDLLVKHSDLTPGNIRDFISDMISLEILNFNHEGPLFELNPKKVKLLSSSQSDKFEYKINSLSDNELLTAQTISMLDVNIDEYILSLFLGFSESSTQEIVSALRMKNILLKRGDSIAPQFVSLGLKKYVYSSIQNKSGLHRHIAQLISQNFNNFNKEETARQFELSGDYLTSKEILLEAINTPERRSAFQYKKKILARILSYPLKEEEKIDPKIQYSKALEEISDFNSCLKVTEELESSNLPPDENVELEIRKAKCFVELGKPTEGIEIFKNILSSDETANYSNRVLLELASAEIDINNYNSSRDRINKLIPISGIEEEYLGGAYNLLGLLDIYESENYEKAAEEFNRSIVYFRNAGNKSRVSAIELNLGNIYSMLGLQEQALEHWDAARKINSEVGNLEQEAKLLLNYGVYYYDKCDYEAATENYRQALAVFGTLGDKDGEGLALLNLGEVYTASCEFQKGIEAIEKSQRIMKSIGNIEEEAESFYLLGRLFAIIGSKKKLNSAVKSYQRLLEKNKLSNRHKKNIDFLSLYIENINEPDKSILKKIKSVQNQFSDTEEREERVPYIQISFLLAEMYLKRDEFKQCISLLNSEKFILLSKSNPYWKAERLYYLGRISRVKNDSDLKPSVEYLQEAFNILEDFSITELTQKVLMELTEYYFSRGNYKKSKKYFIYSKSLFQMIGNNITDIELKNDYFDDTGRTEIMTRIKILEGDLK